jgi:Methylmalonyl Co-A mutase-associated GTPase MeaB
VDELAARLVELRAQLGRAVGVGISGVDCAGKSTLAESLRQRLESLGEAVLVISGDELTRPTRERYARQDEGLSYYRDSFDYRFIFDVRALHAARYLPGQRLHLEHDAPQDGADIVMRADMVQA